VVKAIRPILTKHFKAALLARMAIVPYFPLSGNAMREIVDLKMNQLVARLLESHKIELKIAEKVSQQIVERCSEVETGARNIDHIMSRTLLPLLSQAMLAQMSKGPLPSVMNLDLDTDGQYALSFEA